MKYYNSSIEVQIGDLVMVTFWGAPKAANIINIIFPNTQNAIYWSAPDGGVLLEGEEIGLVLCSALESDEDIEFIKRNLLDEE